jgi:hypothetical protein
LHHGHSQSFKEIGNERSRLGCDVERSAGECDDSHVEVDLSVASGWIEGLSIKEIQQMMLHV